MGSRLERLLTTCLTPLLAATAVKKKTKPKKEKGDKPPHSRPAAKRARATARPTGKGKPRSAKSARKESAAHHKASAQPAVPVGPTGEPLPKPPPPIGRALLLAPENGKYADSIYPKFRWLSVGGATRYEVAWGEKPGSDQHTMISAATEAVVPVEKPLRVGAMYHWRVRGGNEGGWGPWSPYATFQVLEGPP